MFFKDNGHQLWIYFIVHLKCNKSFSGLVYILKLNDRSTSHILSSLHLNNHNTANQLTSHHGKKKKEPNLKVRRNFQLMHFFVRMIHKYTHAQAHTNARAKQAVRATISTWKYMSSANYHNELLHRRQPNTLSGHFLSSNRKRQQ